MSCRGRTGSALGCWSQTRPQCQRLRGHAPLACSSLLLLTAIFKLILNSVKLVFLLDCISYLIVDLPGFAPSSRP